MAGWVLWLLGMAVSFTAGWLYDDRRAVSVALFVLAAVLVCASHAAMFRC